MAKQFGFGKEEKLKSRRRIDALFADGKNFNLSGIRVVYLFESSAKGGIQAGVTTSKRNYPKAVDRNRIKRLLREAYRIGKKELVDLSVELNISGFVFFTWTPKTLPDFASVQSAMTACLARLEKILKQHEVHS